MAFLKLYAQINEMLRVALGRVIQLQVMVTKRYRAMRNTTTSANCNLKRKKVLRVLRIQQQHLFILMFINIMQNYPRIHKQYGYENDDVHTASKHNKTKH